MRLQRRSLLGAGLALAAPAVATGPVVASALDPVVALRRGGYVILMRHATTVPGTGDPPGFDPTDCATQRNLSDAGRAEAVAWGRFFAEHRIPVGHVAASAWCRARETAELVGLGPVEHLPALDSFFADRSEAEPRTQALAAFVRGWVGPGNALLVTHQVNITALTGVTPRAGEAVIVDPFALEVLGRLPPPTG